MLVQSSTEESQSVVVLGASDDVDPNSTTPSSTVRQRRRKICHEQKISYILVFSLLTLLVMFFFGTPLTLILTVPAYVLADKVQYSIAFCYILYIFTTDIVFKFENA